MQFSNQSIKQRTEKIHRKSFLFKKKKKKHAAQSTRVEEITDNECSITATLNFCTTTKPFDHRKTSDTQFKSLIDSITIILM